MDAVMMKNNKSKKLSLSTESVRALIDRDLTPVAGASAALCQKSVPITKCIEERSILCDYTTVCE
jgi:hypothetical protein